MLAAMVAAAQEPGVPFQRRPQRRDARRRRLLAARPSATACARRGPTGVVDPVRRRPAPAGSTRARRCWGCCFAGARCTGGMRHRRRRLSRPTARSCSAPAPWSPPKLLMLAGHRAGRRAHAPRDRACASTPRASGATCTTTSSPRSSSPRRGGSPAVLPGSPSATPTCSGAAGPAWPCPTPNRCTFASRCTTTRGWRAAEAYTIHGGLIRTQSRGNLRLRSADPTAPAVMGMRALSAGADVDALAASSRVPGDRAPAGAGRSGRRASSTRVLRCARRRAARLRDAAWTAATPPGRHVPDGWRRRGLVDPSCGSTASRACGWPTHRSMPSVTTGTPTPRR